MRCVSFCLLAGVVVAGAWAPTAIEGAQTECRTTYIVSASSVATVSTQSRTFAPVPGSAVTLTGTHAGTYCFVVHYSAEFVSAVAQTVRLRVLLDGKPAGAPASIDLPTSSIAEGRTLTFFVPSAGGGETLSVQWMSVKGGAISVRKRSIVVAYFGP